MILVSENFLLCYPWDSYKARLILIFFPLFKLEALSVSDINGFLDAQSTLSLGTHGLYKEYWMCYTNMKRSYLTFAFVAGVSHRLSVFSCYTVCYRGLFSSQSPDYRLSKITPITRSYSEAGKWKKMGQDIVIYQVPQN